jgi:hypothetical protein
LARFALKLLVGNMIYKLIAYACSALLACAIMQTYVDDVLTQFDRIRVALEQLNG